jgi:membrane protein implicated in regulation of membrane protease activity
MARYLGKNAGDSAMISEMYVWLSLGVALLVVEMLSTTVYFLLMAIAAFILAILVSFIKIDHSWQFFIFASISVLEVFVWRLVRNKLPQSVENRQGANDLNNRLSKFIGQEVELEEATHNGRGRVRLEDSYWTVLGADLPKGSKVRIVSVDGMSFHVEAVE